MSLPPTMSKIRLPKNSSGSISLVFSPWASIETRSDPGVVIDARSFQRPVKYSRHSNSSAWRWASESTMPVPGEAVATSDHRVSLRRSSKGKSNRVANIWVVNSIETRSTQLKEVPTGRSSSILPARLRMVLSSFARLGGDTTPLTVAR